MNHYQMYVNGAWRDSAETKPVYDKYTGAQYAEYAVTSAAEVDEAVAAAKKSFKENVLNGTQRYQILKKAAELILEEKEEIAQMITHEAGRMIGDSEWEVERVVTSFDLAAEEARRVNGEMIPTEGMPGQEHKLCFTLRKPIGPVAIIMPFNLPLVLTVNKLAPAIAAGNTIVLKPTTVCPGASVKLVEVLLKAGLPANHIQLILGPGATTGEALLKNQDIAFYCFTGSMEMGVHVRNTVGLRRCSMDLGNNSPVIVHSDADIKAAAENNCGYGFYNAGQVCFRPQRIYVQRSVFDDFIRYAKDFTEKLHVGDPMDRNNYVGPMISTKEVDRVDAWVKEAVSQGATLVCGGKKLNDHVYMPTILANTTRDMKVVKDEIFGPVLVVMPYDTFDEALDAANDSIYGLHGACFTKNINLALKACEKMEEGGIVINDTCATHVPNMPFGGIKNSGAGGNEGPRYTVEEMTDVKTIIIAMGED